MGSPGVLAAAFVLLTAASLWSSSVLIVRLERLGSRLGVTEAVLGLIAALAADAPEITSAVTALVRGQQDVGVGVVLGANIFQLAALLGVGAIIAGGIVLDRRVVAVEALPAVWLALVALGVVSGRVGSEWGLLLAAVVFAAYVVVSALPPERRAHLPVPARFRADVDEAIEEEETELAEVIGPLEHRRSDAPVAAATLLLVVAASASLEAVATELGSRAGLPDVVVGAVVLAVVTSLPNLVAAVHLARRGRGAATLSEAMNSNRINTLVGLLVPAALLGGLAAATGATVLLAAWYVVLTVGLLATAYQQRGLSRGMAILVVACYPLVVLTLLR